MEGSFTFTLQLDKTWVRRTGEELEIRLKCFRFGLGATPGGVLGLFLAGSGGPSVELRMVPKSVLKMAGSGHFMQC